MAEEGTVVAEGGNVTVNGVVAASDSVAVAPPAEDEPAVWAIISKPDGHELINHQGFASNEDAQAWATANRPDHTDVRTAGTLQELREIYDRLAKES